MSRFTPRTILRSTAALASVLLLAACGDTDAEEEIASMDDSPAEAVTAGGPDAVKLAATTDSGWINLGGEVVSTLPTSFILDYATGTVTVEMDDWDWYREGQALAEGDEVVVTGRVDNDLYDEKKIEASSVYLKNLNTYFYASGADEENLAVSTVYVTDAPNYIDSTGFVTAIEGREFTLGGDAGAIRVDTSQLAENPLDDEGFQQVDVGDRVYVWGDFDLSTRENSELMARGVVSLTGDKGQAG
jgi:uncharacterized protein YdeI (BOF family)